MRLAGAYDIPARARERPVRMPRLFDSQRRDVDAAHDGLERVPSRFRDRCAACIRFLWNAQPAPSKTLDR